MKQQTHGAVGRVMGRTTGAVGGAASGEMGRTKSAVGKARQVTGRTEGAVGNRCFVDRAAGIETVSLTRRGKDPQGSRSSLFEVPAVGT